MGSIGNKQEQKTTSWRDANPKYQEKTLGGVYFYDTPNYSSIEKSWYDRLPNYAKEAVVQLDSSDVSVSGWFKVDGGIVYMNHTKSDFLWGVRNYRKRGRYKYENANGFSGDADKYVIDDASS